jgi:hypothetical protein
MDKAKKKTTKRMRRRRRGKMRKINTVEKKKNRHRPQAKKELINQRKRSQIILTFFQWKMGHCQMEKEEAEC